MSRAKANASLNVIGLPKSLREATVVAFTGTEAVSEPFEFQLELELADAIESSEQLEAQCLGCAVGVEVSAADESRWFHGEVAAVQTVAPPAQRCARTPSTHCHFVGGAAAFGLAQQERALVGRVAGVTVSL